ncbi:MAG: hypothetical protein MJA28_02175 [Gammaproteobacteria bacterium]|nr:hypothetical protein [Gammaproteobacteria bacterium]
MKYFHRFAIGLLIASFMVGCSDEKDSTVVVDGDFKVTYVQRKSSAMGNPTDGTRFAAGGDLYMRDLASPGSDPVNITGTYTQGQGDVSDPEVSYDGSKILFSMRGPNDSTWNIWEYTIESGNLHRIISDDAAANAGNDVDPVYLPDGRILFSSSRQEKSMQIMSSEGKEPYAYRDEYEREAVIVLHVMDYNGDNIRQISFNQSHDRNPVVLSSGEIMFARWDHVAGRNHFPLFTTNPDGTGMFVLYGAFSSGNSFLHPRELPSDSPYAGKVISSLMPLSGTHEGGALMLVDIDESDNAQTQATAEEIPIGDGISEKGRFNTPYPLWDGTNRVLVSWTPSQPQEVENPLTGETEMEEGPPHYGIYMFDLDKKSMDPIALPPEGYSLTDAVAVMPRPVPNLKSDTIDPASAETTGILNVKSVYDTDSQGLMGDRVLADFETIPKVDGEADIALLKDPAQTTAAERPGRFLRVTKAVPTPPGMSTDIGQGNFEMQQIIGYTEIEPDGSFKIEVPADTPIGVAVVDSEGRAFQTHTNWIQVRPGERRTCNGCHSPRRSSALNTGAEAGQNHPNTVLVAEQGESMAETRTRLDPSHLQLKADMHYADIWTDETAAGRSKDADLRIAYVGNTNATDDLMTLVPADGAINYPDHIQSIWSVSRGVGGADTCVNCHNSLDLMGNLDLSATVSGTGRLESYESLTTGAPVLGADGLPIVEIDDDGDVEIQRHPAAISVGSAAMSSRTSYLIEKIFEQELRADKALETTVSHSPFLTKAEKRLIAEWVDLGAQYYNDPYISGAGDDGLKSISELRRSMSSLSEEGFASSVHQILMDNCQSCHQPSGSTNGETVESRSGSRFVLTGSEEGDYNITVSMVNDVCSPEDSILLVRPTSMETSQLPHPQIADTASNDPNAQKPVLSTTDAAYQAIFDWINTADKSSCSS